MTDAIVADAPGTGITDRVVVVDIDEPSLEAWGQWPWPRSRLARLLDGIAGMGARAIALDFIMAEPDRTSLKTLHEALKRELGLLQDDENAPPTLPDNDAVLAAIYRPTESLPVRSTDRKSKTGWYLWAWVRPVWRRYTRHQPMACSRPSRETHSRSGHPRRQASGHLSDQ
ncbi:MAG: CHASE2 domain-containing protein [Desulfosarcina sp.]|nr:CHASE2 domain-containing protein [Desulfosarcina sp.]